MHACTVVQVSPVMKEVETDLEQMRAVARGDELAMADLVKRWQVPVLSYICRFLGCPHEEARDIAQEAFLRVWTASGQWRPTARFSTWLFTIVANLCRNQLRTVGRRPILVAIDDQESAVVAHEPRSGPGLDPEVLAKASQLAEQIQRALAELPENQRAALLLKGVHGHSYREIAEILGISESAVESLLVRARRTLAKNILPPAQESSKAGVEPWEDG